MIPASIQIIIFTNLSKSSSTFKGTLFNYIIFFLGTLRLGTFCPGTLCPETSYPGTGCLGTLWPGHILRGNSLHRGNNGGKDGGGERKRKA